MWLKGFGTCAVTHGTARGFSFLSFFFSFSFSVSFLMGILVGRGGGFGWLSGLLCVLLRKDLAHDDEIVLRYRQSTSALLSGRTRRGGKGGTAMVCIKKKFFLLALSLLFLFFFFFPQQSFFLSFWFHFTPQFVGWVGLVISFLFGDLRRLSPISFADWSTGLCNAGRSYQACTFVGKLMDTTSVQLCPRKNGHT